MVILLVSSCFSLPAHSEDSDRPDKSWRHRWEERLANLAPEERQRVIAAHEAANRDPAVQAAREKMHQARKDLQAATRAAMLKSDPSLQAVLDKIAKREKPDE
jgi:hypothetical protein